MLLNFLVLSILSTTCLAKRVYYDWHVHWMNASPDGFERPVIGINNQFPCPTIDVHRGDTIVVDVYNGLRNQTTTIHWHGMHQRGTSQMDGSAGVSQCSIPPGTNFTYEFVVGLCLDHGN